MKIVHINTIDIKGGAARVCWRLTNEQKKLGHEVTTFVGYKYSTDSTIIEIPRRRLYYRLSRFFANDLCFSKSDWILSQPAFLAADVVHCHNIHSGFFNLTTLAKIAAKKPTLWTLQDLWPITGGCTDSFSCRIEKPRRLMKILWDNRQHLLNVKARIYRQANFTPITSSQWMADQLKTSILSSKKNRLIFNGINTDIFKPYPKDIVRQELGLPLAKKIILFIAMGGINDRLKGASFVTDIAKYYQNDPDKVFVAVGGQAGSQAPTDNSPSNIINTGYIGDETILAKYYSAADIFLYPSRADNSPLVVTEAMACGTPVVSFNTDGITEMVYDYGLLASPADGDGLLKQTKAMLAWSPEHRAEMATAGINFVRNRYALKTMTTNYLELYRELAGKFTTKL